MATRRDAREWALQMLFGLDLNAQDPAKVFAEFWKDKNSDGPSRAFAELLVGGIVHDREEIDATISACAEHWDVGRMGAVDRNVLRMAIFEMRSCPDIPSVVSINEAVDLAKYFSSFESGRFVNGILDRVRKDVDLPAQPAEE